jgi:hypothetical protein
MELSSLFQGFNHLLEAAFLASQVILHFSLKLFALLQASGCIQNALSRLDFSLKSSTSCIRLSVQLRKLGILILKVAKECGVNIGEVITTSSLY